MILDAEDKVMAIRGHTAEKIQHYNTIRPLPSLGYRPLAPIVLLMSAVTGMAPAERLN